MKKPVILRKRYIPDETVDISSDELIFRDEELLVTSWKAIRHRPDISGGISCTYLLEGYKISSFFDGKGDFAYWYCDIIDVGYDEKSDTYEIKDLLVDVKVMPDGRILVLDLDELAEANSRELITKDQLNHALNSLNNVLQLIYKESFPPESGRKWFEKR